jgi:hypothetical protein
VVGIRDDESLPDRPLSANSKVLARSHQQRESTASAPGGISRSRRTSRSSVGSVGSKGKLVPVPDDLLGKIGQKGRCLGEFANPQGVCCLSNGSIAVSDSNNQCVQVFTDKGDCVLK